MDVSFTNVVEGTRPYFLGVPKSSPGQTKADQDSEATSHGAARPLWSGAAPHTPQAAEATPAQSGAPAMPNSRPPSVAAVQPPRPPSEGLLEPKPHIIHKATVVQEALQKQREKEAMLDSPEDIDRPSSEMAMSPPSHIIHKPSHSLSETANKNNLSKSEETVPAKQQNDSNFNQTVSTPSPSKIFMQPPHTPSPLPNVHTPSPRPPTQTPSPHPRMPTTSPHPRVPTPVLNKTSAATQQLQRIELSQTLPYNVPHSTAAEVSRYSQMRNYPIDQRSQVGIEEYRKSIIHVQTHERQTDTHLNKNENAHRAYRRISTSSAPYQRNSIAYQTSEDMQKSYDYLGNAIPTSSSYSVSQSAVHNDRVPPIVHPSHHANFDKRIYQVHPQFQTKTDVSHSYSTKEKYTSHRQIHPSHYPNQANYAVQTTHSTSVLAPGRGYDSREYRNYPSTKVSSSSMMNNNQVSPKNHFIHKQQSTHPDFREDNRNNIHPKSQISQHYTQNVSEQSHSYGHNLQKHSYPPPNRQAAPVSHAVVARNSYSYAYTVNSSINTTSTSTVASGHQLPTTNTNIPAVHSPYESHSQTSPTRSIPSKPGYGNHQPRMTVSVTSLVNQMNQTKHKKESPLDLSVKTVKNPADSTDEIEIRHSLEESKNHPSGREIPSTAGYMKRTTSQEQLNRAPINSSLKVDFLPNFQTSYSDQKPVARMHDNLYNPSSQRIAVPVAHQSSRPYDSIASTKPFVKKPPPEPYFIDNRYQPKYKYPTSKRTDTSSPKIDLTQAMGKDHFRDLRDQRYLEETRKRFNGPVVSNIPEKIMRHETWTSDSRLDKNRSSRSFSNSALDEQQKLMSQPVYRYSNHKQIEAYQHTETRRSSNHVYPETTPILHHSHSYTRQKEAYYSQKLMERPNKPVIQRTSNVRLPTDYNGSPADKNTLSILRNSLETRQTGLPKTENPVTIVIDDAEDTFFEITEQANQNKIVKPILNHLNSQSAQKIHMPKAVDSIQYDSDSSQKYMHNEDRNAQNRKPESETIAVTKSPEADVASRIRTKAELKGFTLPIVQNDVEQAKIEDQYSTICKPKSQKQHLFNQLHQENQSAKYEAVDSKHIHEASQSLEITPVTNDKPNEEVNAQVQTVPSEEDLFWGSMCENFVEQLKTKVIPKKKRKSKLSCELERATELKEEPKLERTTELQEEPKLERAIELKEERKEVDETTSIGVIISCNPDKQLIRNFETETHDPLGDIGSVKIKQEPLAQIDEVVDNLVSTTINLTENNDSSNKLPILLSCLKPEPPPLVLKSEEQSNKLLDIVKNEIVELRQPIKQEIESSDDDLPLIKSKLLKEKQTSKHKLRETIKMKTKQVFVKLENCNFEKKKSADIKTQPRIRNRTLKKSINIESKELKRDLDGDTSQESDTDERSMTSRLRTRKTPKIDESKETKLPLKSSPKKHPENTSTPLIVQDKSNFQNKFPGWEEQLYRYKRSLRMPTRLINVPKSIARISSSLPDLDPTPVSPAPSTSTDELCSRRNAGSGWETNDKTNDSDLESDCSSLPKVNYDSETSNSTIFSSTSKKKGESILDLLIQKYGKKEDSKKKGSKKVEKGKSNNLNENETANIEGKISLRDPLKEAVTNVDKASIKCDDVDRKVENSRIQTEGRGNKSRLSTKELLADERPASAPPACINKDDNDKKIVNKRLGLNEKQVKLKKKIVKDKVKLKSNIREGLRSTRSKGNDAKGRLLRLKKRNNIMLKGLAHKKVKKIKKEPKINILDSKEIKDENENSSELVKKKLRRLFQRRKFSSGFDYLKKKKKFVRKEDDVKRKGRKRAVSRPSPASINDLQKEIKAWIINKSIGETHLHRAARLGYTDCAAYCLENMNIPSSCRDNAGFTPLHVAAQRGHLQIAKILLQYGADVSSAAQGGICPLHEASENDDIEMIRLLLSYGADPALATYSGVTPAELASGEAAFLIEKHIADTQGKATQPWHFEGPSKIFDPQETGCDVVRSPPERSPSPPPQTLEFVSAATPLPPLYTLRPDTRTYYCLLHDLLTTLQVKKDAFLKQIYSGSGSPKDNLKELKTQDFLERAQCQQFMGAGEKINIRASKIALVPYTDKVKELLDIDTVLVR